MSEQTVTRPSHLITGSTVKAGDRIVRGAGTSHYRVETVTAVLTREFFGHLGMTARVQWSSGERGVLWAGQIHHRAMPAPASKCPGHLWITLQHEADDWTAAATTSQACSRCDARS